MVLFPRYGSARRLSTYLAIIVFLFAILYLIPNRKLLATRLNQSGIQLEWRIQRWNWISTSEEIFCQSAHELPSTKPPIPNMVHFVILARETKQVELSYSDFLAIKAVILRMNASEIKLHTTALNTANKWYLTIKHHITLIPIDLEEYRSPDGRPFTSICLAHQSDIIRLDILTREGGIYLDTDVFALRSFSNLLTNQRDVLMGHEGGNRYGLCNAVTIARPNSQFMELWHQSYSTFDSEQWNEHSVRMPKLLQVQHPDLICPLSPTTFFWPTWAVKHVEYMHEPITAEEKDELRENMATFGGAMYENQLAFHAVAAKDYLPLLTPEVVQEKDTRFNVLVREIASAPLP
ncbi:unnamed protein product [Zymoseptoria tritici ST99CH_1A5]|nr:unnamed protein product [Zymoseptoria tritici ST99CH_1A5]